MPVSLQGATEKVFFYRGPRFPEQDICPIPYQPNFFQIELNLESELFGEMRERNGIRPYRINESSPDELENIRTFFEQHRDTFYFLFDQQVLIGSILFIGTCIQSLGVARAYQRKGYGTKLTMLTVNQILGGNHDHVEVRTLPGNETAERLYRTIGFVEST